MPRGQTATVPAAAPACRPAAPSHRGSFLAFAPAVKPGNVRNIIQHFENNQHYESQEPGAQRLSTGSFPEDLLESDRWGRGDARGSRGSFWWVYTHGDIPACPARLSLLSALSPRCSSRAEVKLGRSESLKGREEMKKSRKAENVPRSRSDVDMDAAAEATRLHQSASSSASSLSTRWGTPCEPRVGRTGFPWVCLASRVWQLRHGLLEKLLLSLGVKAKPWPRRAGWSQPRVTQLPAE